MSKNELNIPKELLEVRLKDVEDNERIVLEDRIFVKKDRYYEKVKIADIHYVKADGNYLDVYCDGVHYTLRTSLKEFGKLLTKNFIQTHRSYVVNMDKVEAISYSSVRMQDQEIPVSNKYRDRINDAVIRFI